jgi:hypothetical protein
MRMLCADIVEVNWRDEAGKARQATGLLEDICPSGACLQLETAVPVGAQIRWQSPEQVFTGRVRHCLFQEIGYFVGVEFNAASKWSKEEYEPQHLLDLGRLVGRDRD